MAPKTDTTKNLSTLETAVEKLQKDVEKINVLEMRVTELTHQLGKLDILERLEKRMMKEDRRSTLLGKQPEDDTQTSGLVASRIEGSQRPSVQNTHRFSEQGRRSTEPPEWNEPLTRKMEIPLFDGENVESWVLRVEQYFELGDFTEGEKLRAVRMCFDGEALSWYRWERDRHPFSSWEQMKHRVLESFATAQDLSPGERLLTLRQDDTAGKYCKEFIFLASNAPEVPENVLEMAFMSGLKPKTRAGVKMFEPRSLKK